MLEMNKRAASDQTSRITRRRTLLRVALLLTGSSLGAMAIACAPAPAPSPAATAAPLSKPPAAPTTAPAPTAKPIAPTQQPAATQAPPKPKVLAKWLHLETTRVVSSAYRLMTTEKGFDRQNGIEAEIRSVSGGGTGLIKALVAGEADTIEPGFPPITPSIEQGAEMKIIGSFMPGVPMALFVRKDINDLRDLYGKNIGISGVGALFHQIFRLLMLDAGLDSDQLTFVNPGGGSPAIFQALTVGKIDAGISGTEYIPLLPQYPDLKILFRVGERMPKFLYDGFVVSNKAIKEKPEQLTNFLAAYSLGRRYAVDHPDETAALAAKITSQEASATRPEIDRYAEWNLNNPNFDIPEENLKYMQESMVRLGDQKVVLPTEKVADYSFQKKVMAQLGVWKRSSR